MIEHLQDDHSRSPFLIVWIAGLVVFALGVAVGGALGYALGRWLS